MGTVTVEWKEHSDVLIRGLLDLFVRECQVDIDITFGGDRLKVHRLVLAIFLPAFKNCRTALNFEGIADSIDDVRALVDFVYTGQATVAEDRIDRLRRLADDLNFKGLSEAIAGRSVKSEPDVADSTSWDVVSAREQEQNPPPDDDDDVHEGIIIKPEKRFSPMVMRRSRRRSRAPNKSNKPMANDVHSRRREEVSVKHSEKRLTTDSPTIRCEPCDLQFDSKSKFRLHFKRRHTVADAPYTCKYCDFTALRLFQIQRHVTERHRRTSSTLKCDTCKALFTTRGSLTKHVRTVHEGEKPYRCQECSKAFTRSCNLILHVKSKHSRDPTLHVCALCDRTYVSRGNLQSHVRSVHKLRLVSDQLGTPPSLSNPLSSQTIFDY